MQQIDLTRAPSAAGPLEPPASFFRKAYKAGINWGGKYLIRRFCVNLKSAFVVAGGFADVYCDLTEPRHGAGRCGPYGPSQPGAIGGPIIAERNPRSVFQVDIATLVSGVTARMFYRRLRGKYPS